MNVFNYRNTSSIRPATASEGESPTENFDDFTSSSQPERTPELVQEELAQGLIPDEVKRLIAFVELPAELQEQFQEELLAVTKRLFPDESRVQDGKMRFLITDPGEGPNAFAIPTANPPIIGITRDVFRGPEASENIEQLEALLAHEMGHLIIKDKHGPDANSKLEEGMADMIATEALWEAGTNPMALITLLEQLEDSDDGSLFMTRLKRAEELLKTALDVHPNLNSRRSIVEATLTRLELERGEKEVLEPRKLTTLNACMEASAFTTKYEEQEPQGHPFDREYNRLNEDARLRILAECAKKHEFQKKGPLRDQLIKELKHLRPRSLYQVLEHPTRAKYQRTSQSVSDTFVEVFDDLVDLGDTEFLQALAGPDTQGPEHEFFPFGKLQSLEKKTRAFIEAASAETIRSSELEMIKAFQDTKISSSVVSGSAFTRFPEGLASAEHLQCAKASEEHIGLNGLLFLCSSDPKVLKLDPETTLSAHGILSSFRGDTEDFPISLLQGSVDYSVLREVVGDYLIQKYQEMDPEHFADCVIQNQYEILEALEESGDSSGENLVPFLPELMWKSLPVLAGVFGGASWPTRFEVQGKMVEEIEKRLRESPEEYTPKTIELFQSVVEHFDDFYDPEHELLDAPLEETYDLPIPGTLLDFVKSHIDLLGEELSWQTYCRSRYLNYLRAGRRCSVYDTLTFLEDTEDFRPKVVAEESSWEEKWEKISTLLEQDGSETPAPHMRDALLFEAIELIYEEKNPDEPKTPPSEQLIRLLLLAETGKLEMSSGGMPKTLSVYLDDILLSDDYLRGLEPKLQARFHHLKRSRGMYDSKDEELRELENIHRLALELSEATERKEALGELFKDSRGKPYRIEEPELRSKVMNSWIKQAAEVIGIDDSSSEVRARAQSVLQFIKNNTPSVDRRYLLNELANAIQSQPALCYEFEAVVPTTCKEDFDLASQFGGAAEGLLHYVRGNERFAKSILEYLSRPLSQYSLEHFSEKVSLEISSKEYKREFLNSTPQLVYLHKNFWVAPLEQRSILLKELLTLGGEADERQEKDNYFYVLDATFPHEQKYAPEARAFVTDYVGALPSYSKWFAIAALLAAGQPNERGGARSTGSSLALFCELMGPAETKIGQTATSYLPEELQQDMERLKNKAAEPMRWDIFHWIEKLPEEEREDLGHLGEILGSASFFVTVGLSKDSRDNQNITEVLQLKRPYVEERATTGFRRLSQLQELERRYGSDWREILELAAEDSETEGDLSLSEEQFSTAEKLYSETSITVHDEDGEFTFHCRAPELHSCGETSRRISYIGGDHFVELLEPKEKKRAAKAILTLELANIVRGKGFDKDRHGGNIKVDGLQIGFFDFGGMSMMKPREEELTLLGEVLYDCTKRMGNNVSFRDAFSSAVQSRVGESSSAPKFLKEVKRALLPLEEYRKLLTDEDLKDVISAVMEHAADEVRVGITKNATAEEKKGFVMKKVKGSLKRKKTKISLRYS